MTDAVKSHMAKSSLSFVCQNCGAAYNRWQGKCEACGEWNTLSEEEGADRPCRSRSAQGARAGSSRWNRCPARARRRRACLLAWPSSTASPAAVLSAARCCFVGGDPGIGKSTLLTQATASLARAGHRAVYISGEEAVAQVRLRAERLGLADAPVSWRPRLRSKTSSQLFPKARSPA